MNIFKQPLFFSESDPLVDGRGTEDVTSQDCFICRLRDMYVVHSTTSTGVPGVPQVDST